MPVWKANAKTRVRWASSSLGFGQREMASVSIAGSPQIQLEHGGEQRAIEFRRLMSHNAGKQSGMVLLGFGCPKQVGPGLKPANWFLSQEKCQGKGEEEFMFNYTLKSKDQRWIFNIDQQITSTSIKIKLKKNVKWYPTITFYWKKKNKRKTVTCYLIIYILKKWRCDLQHYIVFFTLNNVLHI